MSDYYSNDIKQTHTIIFPPPNFTVSTIVSLQKRLQKKVVMRKSHDEPKHKQLLNINIYIEDAQCRLHKHRTPSNGNNPINIHLITLDVICNSNVHN